MIFSGVNSFFAFYITPFIYSNTWLYSTRMAEEKAKFKFPKRLIIVYATVFVDAFGYSFIMPILPYYTEILNGTAFELGVLLSIYALTQAFSILSHFAS